MIPSYWGNLQWFSLLCQRESCCLQAWFYFHTLSITDWLIPFEFLSYMICHFLLLFFPILCSLFSNLPLFLTVSILILSWSHFPHHATIQSSPRSTFFSTSLPVVGQRDSDVFRCHPGLAGKWASKIWQTVWKLSIPEIYLHADCSFFRLSIKPGVFFDAAINLDVCHKRVAFFKISPTQEK